MVVWGSVEYGRERKRSEISIEMQWATFDEFRILFPTQNDVLQYESSILSTHYNSDKCIGRKNITSTKEKKLT